MSEPLIPFVKLPEIPLSFLSHIPLINQWIDGADPPSIKPFGTLVALGVYLGTLQVMGRARDRGYDPRLVSDYIFWTVASGFVISHVLDAIFYHPATVMRDPLYLLKIWDGLSSYGGFIGAVVGSIAWKLYRRQKVLGYIDITVSGMPLAWVFGRMGCSVVHDHPGILSDHWFAVRFPPRGLMQSVEWLHWGPPYIGRFDLGLIEMVLTIPLAVAVAWLWRRDHHRPDGYYIAVVCMAYPPVRFLLDFLRVGPDAAVMGADPRYGGLTPAQWASLLMFGTAVAIFRYMRKQGGRGATALAAASGPTAGSGDEPDEARESGPSSEETGGRPSSGSPAPARAAKGGEPDEADRSPAEDSSDGEPSSTR